MIEKDLKTLLRESGYEVIASVKNYAVLVSFPQEYGDIVYVINEDGVVIFDDLIKLPPYAVRTFILADICTKARSIGYDPKLLVMKVNDQEVSEDIFLEAIHTYNEDDLTELLFRDLIMMGISRSFDAECDACAATYNLYDGYLVLKTLFGDVRDE